MSDQFPMEVLDKFETTHDEPVEHTRKDGVFYISQPDIESIEFALETFLKLPKAKFSPRYSSIQKIHKQFKDILK